MFDRHDIQQAKPLTEAQILYHGDLARLRGQRGALLELLIDERWHPNYECAEVGGLSFQCSIYAFRKEGWIIESRPKRKGVWEYRLTGKGDPSPHRPMSEPQVLVAGHYMHVIQTELGRSAAKKVRQALPEWMRSDPKPVLSVVAAESQTGAKDLRSVGD